MAEGRTRRVAQAHWTERLFLENADIFLRIHESALDQAEAQARDVMSILRRGSVLPPAPVLDVPCGIGRHSAHLAKFGYTVTAVDFAPRFLERGRRLAAELGSAPQFLEGDLRRIRDVVGRRDGMFSAILNLWTSIGYWGEEVDRDIFRQFHALAVPGGLLVIDTISHDWLVKNYQRYGYEEWGDLVHIEDRDWDVRTAWMNAEWRFYTRRNGDLVHKATIPVVHRVYAPHELKRAVESAGWRTLGLFGSLAMESYGPDRPRIVLVARKEG